MKTPRFIADYQTGRAQREQEATQAELTAIRTKIEESLARHATKLTAKEQAAVAVGLTQDLYVEPSSTEE